MNIILAILAFNFIVIAHELGHFIVAKLSDIKVLEFSLFVGPKLFSIKRGETEYSLRLFPILAYVRMEGEEEESDNERAFNKKPLHIRAAVIAAGPLSNIIIAIVVLSIVFSITGFTTTKLDYVEADSPAYEASLQKDDIILKYDGKRVYHPMDVVQFVYVYKGKPAEVEVLRDGKKFTAYITPEVIPERELYLIGVSVENINGELSNVISQVIPNSPAEAAGIMPGDKVVKLNDVSVSKKADIDNFMKENKANPVKMTIERNNSQIVLDITPYVEKIPEQYYVGIEFEARKGNLFETVRNSISYAYSTIRSVVYSIGWLITGRAPLSQIMGPIGIVSEIGNVVEQGTTLADKLIYLLNIAAFISIAMGAMNLVPFPALDGNKLLLILVEVVRKKPIPPEKEAVISTIGFIILILLALFTVYNDTLRLIRGG